jgi:hypothetical protein
MYPSHDHLFKELLRAFPAEWVRLVVPDQATRLSFGTLELQPTETFLDVLRGEERRFDLMMRVESRAGERLLLHLEVEREFRRGMAARLWDYNRLVRLRHGLPVHTAVLYLRGGPRGLAAESHRERWLGRPVCGFRYTALGLSRAPAAAFLRRRNPLAWALAALMRWPGSRAEHQLACLTPIARARNLTEVQRFLLFNTVTTYLQLQGDAVRQYETMLAGRRHREVRAMIMTWADKKIEEGRQQGLQEGLQEGLQQGIERGLERGREEGIRAVVLRLLARRFSPLPAAVARRVSAMVSSQELETLADRILEARSLEELGLA